MKKSIIFLFTLTSIFLLFSLSALPVKTEWELTLYNVLGQEVDNIKDKSDAGYVKIEWDASRYASGVYFYRLRAGHFSSTKKMVLLK